MNFRANAHKSLERAKVEIAANDPARLRYAALELRMCIEALTYARAKAYGDEFPPVRYQTWQPKRVIQELLSLDAYADQGSTIDFNIECGPTELPQTWQSLGTERIFGLKEIKETYDALGNFLHHPTLKQFLAGGVPDEKIRAKCESVAQALDKVFASPFHHAIFASRISFPCDCGKNQIKRVPHDETDGEATCFDCGAIFDLIMTEKANGESSTKYRAQRRTREVHCPASGCENISNIPSEKVHAGLYWSCKGCGKKVGFALGVCTVDPEPS